MEFLKERVYTSVNADELKVGSKVILANDLATLKCYVRDRYGVTELQSIRNEDWISRFGADGTCYALCYLIKEPEEKKLKWADLKLGDVIRRYDSSVEYLVTAVDKDKKKKNHIYTGFWVDDDVLEDYYEKVDPELE